MTYYAIGPVAGGALTARQIRRAGVAADLGTLPTGEQSVDVTAAVGDTPQAFVGRRFTVPGGVAHAPAAPTAADRRVQLYGAVQQAYAAIQPHWADIAVTGTTATRATARWLYHTTALLDRIAAGDYRSGTNAVVAVEPGAVIRDWLAFLRGGGVAAWYGVMDANASLASAWSGFAITAGSVIYCDAITAGTGTWRTPDGRSDIIHSNNPIPAGFTTETQTLRTS